MSLLSAAVLLAASSLAIADNSTFFKTDTLAACLLNTGGNSYSPYRINTPPYTTGVLHSPNFGNGRFYPPHSLCRWAIAAPPGHVIFVNISILHIDATPPPSGMRSRNTVPLGQSAMNTFSGSASNNMAIARGRSSILLPSVELGVAAVDAASGCEGDYLEILDGTDYRQRHQLIGRYCSDGAPRPIVSVYNEIQIVFQSDGFKEDVGFELHYVAVPPDDVVIGRDGRLHVQSLEASRFEDSSLEDNELLSPRTSYELLDFPMMGPSSDDVLLRPSSNLYLFGGDTGKKAKSSSRPVTSQVVTDDRSCTRGARILTDDVGNFSSPNFGRGQYPPGSHCEWLITAPRDRIVLFEFEELRIEYGLETRGCTFDYVEIFDGRDPTAPVLSRFCGRALPKMPIRSTSNYLFIIFQSDLSREDFGFSANYQIVSASPGCDGAVYELNGKSGEIMSPNFGYGQYPSNSECRWLIRVPESFYVTLSFIDFDIESLGQEPSFGNGGNDNSPRSNGHRRCSYDFLEVFDGPNPDDSRSFGRYCGTATPSSSPKAIRASQNALSLVFRTDFSGERRGFRLQFTAILPYPGCEGHPHIMHEPSGEITSPNFGQDSYPPNSNCLWIVDPGLERPAFITVSFMHFQIEGRYSSSTGQVTCPYDFVEIRLAASHEGFDMPHIDMFDDGAQFTSDGDGDPKGRRRFCGQSLPAPFTLRGRRLSVLFHSDFNKQDVGFWLRYEVHEAPSHERFLQHFKSYSQIHDNMHNKFRHQTLVNMLKLSTPNNGAEDKPKPTVLKVEPETTTTVEPETTVAVTTAAPETTTETTTQTTASETAMFSMTAQTTEVMMKHEQEIGIENGEFMLVVDEDFTQQKLHKQLEKLEKEQARSREETTTPEIEGIIIDEWFGQDYSGDGEYPLVEAEEMGDVSNYADLSSILYDPLPGKSAFGELVPLDPSSILQPNVLNVTLLSFFDNQQGKANSD